MVLPKNTIPPSGLRGRLHRFVESSFVIRFITLLIIINSVTLGLETNPELSQAYGPLLLTIDKSILMVFSLELLLKFAAYRLDFFKSGWNNFDFFIVTIAWIPAIGAFSILRSLRILRVFRLFSIVPQMRRVLTALLHSIPGMLSVVGILTLIFYVCAVLATTLFGGHQDPQLQQWFGSVSASLYTLFQIMTLESWSMGIVRPTMEIYPLSWLYFLPFIIVTSFAVLNLFIGIIVDAMQTAQQEPRESDKSELKQFTHLEVESLHSQLDRVQGELASLKALIASRKRSRGEQTASPSAAPTGGTEDDIHS
ncbi:ion transporter [Desulfogranum mediterraneum]|uniref:ion transporter n=1 Tax=Desulfogranum mediterraneum TaxID=160661 RepID=UPI0004193162|nr:ion transporter [Desulfogranum mediterraneum]